MLRFVRMGSGGAKRNGGRVVAACLAAVMLLGVLIPSAAFGASLKGSRIEWYRPKSVSSSKFTIKAKVMTAKGSLDDYSIKYVKLTGTKSKTKYYVTTYDGQTLKRKKVGYSAFKKYFSKESWRPVGTADYVWKKSSSGKRYRYLRKIDITFYAD